MTNINLENPNSLLSLHHDDARNVLLRIRDIAPLITGFQFAPPEGISGLTIGPGSVPIPFVEANAVALEALPLLTSAAGGPQVAAGLRDDIAYHIAYTPIWQELDLLSRGVRYTLALRRQRMGQVSFRVFYLAKGLNRDQVVPHVETMKAALGRSGRPSKAVIDVPAEPAPAPKPGGAS